MRARTSWASLSAGGPLLLRSAMTGCYAVFRIHHGASLERTIAFADPHPLAIGAFEQIRAA